MQIATPREQFLVGVTNIGCHLPNERKNFQYSRYLEFLSLNPGLFDFVVFEKAAYLFFDVDHRIPALDSLDSLPLGQGIENISVSQSRMKGVVDYLSLSAEVTNVVWFGPRLEPHIRDITLFKNGCNEDYRLRTGQK